MNTDSLRQELYATLKADKRADTYVIPHRVMDVLAEAVATKVQEARIDELQELVKNPDHVPETSDYSEYFYVDVDDINDRIAELQALKDKGEKQ